VRILLDTHALLWWLFDDPLLSREARRVIARPANEILVSAASGWEIATKHRLGKLPEATEAASGLPMLLRKARFSSLDVTMAHGLAAGALPGPHRDPFDRMLIAQSRDLDVPVVTRDAVFAQYGVACIW
jgi:PIN domain nuclease of toxin-antitoxin system